MNRDRGIRWCTHTFNPICGCQNNCDAATGKWCYARRMAARGMTGCALCKSFTPHLHEERLFDLGLRSERARVIFADSMSDPWSAGMKQEWRTKLFVTMRGAPQHTYILLTKKPEFITEIDLKYMPFNLWLGVSVTCKDDMWRVWEFARKAGSIFGRLFVSFEPLLGRIFPLAPEHIPIFRQYVSWCITGPQTGAGKWDTDYRWFADVRTACLDIFHIPLWEKDTLSVIWAMDGKRVQQAPPAIATILDDWRKK